MPSVFVGLIAVGALLGLARPTDAASFDCRKSATEVEKLICSDAELSRADEEITDAYRAVLAASMIPSAPFRYDQRYWLSKRNGQSPSQLATFYREHIAELRSLAERWNKARKPVKVEEAKSICVELPTPPRDLQCRVITYDQVKNAQRERLTFQRQCHWFPRPSGDGGDCIEDTIVVFQSTSASQLIPIAAAYE